MLSPVVAHCRAGGNTRGNTRPPLPVGLSFRPELHFWPGYLGHHQPYLPRHLPVPQQPTSSPTAQAPAGLRSWGKTLGAMVLAEPDCGTLSCWVTCLMVRPSFSLRPGAAAQAGRRQLPTALILSWLRLMTDNRRNALNRLRHRAAPSTASPGRPVMAPASG